MIATSKLKNRVKSNAWKIESDAFESKYLRFVSLFGRKS